MPSGTVTFLFTDIEGSTTRWEHRTAAMQAALARHDGLLRAAILEHDGHVVKTTGDGLHAAFSRAPDAVAAAVDAQHRLAAESWDEIGGLRVRMALHTGAADERDGDYYGPPLNRAARLLATGHGGQVLLSDVTAGLVRDDLSSGLHLRDLGEHRLKDLIRPERVFQLVMPGLSAEFPPLVSLDARPHNLPVQVTALLGREQDVQAVRSLLLRDGVRLVTLTGPGGTGKTRLSLQVAADLLEFFEDGAFVAELAPISDPDLVLSTIAQTLGVRDAGGRPVRDAIIDYLHDRRLLLLLDNFEQVLTAAPVVTDLLRACAGLSVLATSRAPLQIGGEHEFPVPPLALPEPVDLTRPMTAERLSQYAAVALFIERAVAVKPDFTVTNQSAPAIAEICVRLDGLPLAVELAAARTRLLSPDAMLARLGHGLALLTGGRRDLPARQQTLRGAIAWSHDLLDPDEQRLFRRLGVFVGGFTLDAAEAVCDVQGDLGIDVLDGLESLVSKSLVKQQAGATGDARFSMLETIREYAAEQLEASGKAAAIQERHTNHFLALAIASPRTPEGFDRVEQDHDNLRAALQWLTEQGDAERAMRLAAALTSLWGIRGYLTEGRDRLARALALPQAQVPADARAAALYASGRLAFNQSDYAAAQSFWERGLALWRELGNPGRVADGLRNLGHLARERGDYATARTLLTESLEGFRATGEVGNVGRTIDMLGLVVLQQGDYAAARGLFQQALEIAREHQNEFGIMTAIARLGHVAQAEGNLAEARARYEESLVTQRRWDDKRAIASLLRNLGMVLIDEGQLTMAWSRFEESAALVRHLHDRSGTASVLDGLAGLAAVQGQPDRALRLAGAAAAFREVLGKSHPRNLQDWIEHKLAPARAALGTEATAAAWAEGQAMGLDRAITYALEVSTPAASA
jgi:predicted ATPase/class 3 adenylate cyclase